MGAHGRGVAWGATGTCVGAMGTPGAPRCPRNAGKASCWLNLNTALLREQLLSIRSKRKKLGEELGGWGGSTGGFPGAHVVEWGGNGGGNVLPAELRHRASPWQRNVGYPLAMLGLLALTVRVPIPTCATAPYGCPKSLLFLLLLLFSGHLSAHRLLPRLGAAAG